MEELLKQALQLTLYGMGMTFAAIGTLVLGMYLLTALTAERRVPAEEDAPAALESASLEGASLEGASLESTASSGEARYLAAAAAVAAALATAAPEAGGLEDDTTMTDDVWNGYVRERRLTQRLHHDLRSERRRLHHT